MKSTKNKTTAGRRLSRRHALATLAAGGALATVPAKLWAQTPAIRRKVKLTYWG